MSTTPSPSDPRKLLYIAALFLVPLFAYSLPRLSTPPAKRPYHRPPSPIATPSHGVTSLAFSPDGLTLATGTGDGALSLWNVPQGTLRWSQPARGARPSTVAFSPDGRLLAATSAFSLSLRRLPSMRLQKTLALPYPLVSCVAFSPNSQLLAVGCATGDLYKGFGELSLWNIATGQKTVLPGRTDYVGSLAFSPDGHSLVATCGLNRAALPAFKPVNLVRSWNLRTHALHWEVAASYPSADIAFSPDGKLIGAGNSTPQLLDPQTGKTARALGIWPGSAVHLAFSPDSQILAGSGTGSPLTFWNTTTGQWLGHSHDLDHFDVTSLCFSRDGQRLASANGQTTIKIWDSAPLSTKARTASPQLTPHLLQTIDTLQHQQNSRSSSPGQQFPQPGHP